MAARAVDARLVADAAKTISRLAAVPPWLRAALAELRFRADGESLERATQPRGLRAPLLGLYPRSHRLRRTRVSPCQRCPGVAGAWSDFVARNGQAPRIIVVQGLGAFSCANRRRRRFGDTPLRRRLQGGRLRGELRRGLPHDEGKIEFIRNWEVEKYRSSVSTGE